jgi:hypothetical protein
VRWYPLFDTLYWHWACQTHRPWSLADLHAHIPSCSTCTLHAGVLAHLILKLRAGLGTGAGSILQATTPPHRAWAATLLLPGMRGSVPGLLVLLTVTVARGTFTLLRHSLLEGGRNALPTLGEIPLLEYCEGQAGPYIFSPIEIFARRVGSPDVPSIPVVGFRLQWLLFRSSWCSLLQGWKKDSELTFLRPQFLLRT